jgi:hypothetical protein
MAWIIIVAMSDPAETGVALLVVAGVEAVGVVAAALLVGVPESRGAGVAAAAFAVGRFCAAARVATVAAVVLAMVYVVAVAALVVFGEVVAGALAAAFCGADFVSRGVKGNLVPLAAGFADAVVAVVLPDCALAASSTAVVSEMVSRSGERAFRMVAGATIVIERVTGAWAVGAAGVTVVVAGVVVPAGVGLPGLGVLALCWSSMSEKLCD